MESLISLADALDPLKTNSRSRRASLKRKPVRNTSTTVPAPTPSDPILSSIYKRTGLPKSLRSSSPLPEGVNKYSHIADLKLRTRLVRQAAHKEQTKTLLKDAELLLDNQAGSMEVEGEMERTWRTSQDEIMQTAGQEAAKGRRELKLDGGPYRSRFTKNGRHLAIVGNSGHVAAFDWQRGTVHTELQLKETCRDITFLFDHSHFAVAQKKYVFIYDRDGVEIHRLKAHVEPTRLEFLPYHWLLASVGYAGYLKYQDTSTGQLLVEHRTKLGACLTMAQNLHNAVIHLGHQNGTVTLWTPNLPQPAVRLLAHLGPVVSLSVDPSQGGRYMATAGQDAVVKVWDCRNWKTAVREWVSRHGSAQAEWSQRGHLAVGSGGTIEIYTAPTVHNHFSKKIAPPLYLTHPIPHRPITSFRFQPFQDVLAVGHAAGLSSLLVPGSGEPNFDSTEADPFESKIARREREVKALLDKIQPDLITLDPDFIGSIAPLPKLTEVGEDGRTGVPYSQLPRYERLRIAGKADEFEKAEDVSGDDGEGEGDGEGSKMRAKSDKEKKKMRGKKRSLKRYLRRQLKKNVIDPKAVAIRAKLEKQREETRKARLAAKGIVEERGRKRSALDRFRQAP